MLYDADWIRFFLRAVTPNNDLLPPKSAAKLKHFPALRSFIFWVLVRDPELRPTMKQLRMKFAAVRRDLSGRSSSADDTVDLANDSIEGGLWAIDRGYGSALAIRWPVSPAAPAPIPLSAFFPTPTPSTSKSTTTLEDDNTSGTVKEWRLSSGKMVPTFTSSSRLDGIFFSDLVTLLSAPLHDSHITAAIVCTRGSRGTGGEFSRHRAGERLTTTRADIESNSLITRFRRAANVAGIETHVAALPRVTARGAGAQAQFSDAMRSATHFARRALFPAGVTEPTVDAVANEAARGGERGRVLLVCTPADAATAMAVAASIHICARDGGICAAAFALSPAAALEGSLPTLHPTDAARLTAWEARTRADAEIERGHTRSTISRLNAS